jgi:hypothetical protein
MPPSVRTILNERARPNDRGTIATSVQMLTMVTQP